MTCRRNRSDENVERNDEQTASQSLESSSDDEDRHVRTCGAHHQANGEQGQTREQHHTRSLPVCQGSRDHRGA